MVTQIKLKTKLPVDNSPPVKPTMKEVASGYREFTGEEVSLWHFFMMNDPVRNNAYDQALGRAIKPGVSQVLDIGTGAGLLSMMAARHGAKVTTCEAIPAIAKKAKEIFKKNGFEHTINAKNTVSSKLEIGKDAPEKFDILVTEIFDDGLLGEGAFNAIKDAKKHLLKPNAQIIPAACRVMAMGIESAEFFSHYHVEQASGFDVSAFNEFTLQGYVGWHLDKWKYRGITKPTEIFAFNFSNLPGAETKDIDLVITETGNFHAIAFWFELQMDEHTVLSSGPGLERLSSWKQALQLHGKGTAYKAGDKIRLTARHNEEEIWFEERS